MKSSKARPFHAIATPKPSPVPKSWGYSVVKIFRGDEEVGSYTRNYPSFAIETFEPFEIAGNWYALYSSDYTSTRIMKLPECNDIGGEERSAGGFCPVELYVPRYRKVESKKIDSGKMTESTLFESAAEESASLEGYEYSYGPWLSLDVGFIAGCLWGDDSSWKLEVIDLKRAADGIISRTARFGHLQLGTMPLAEAVKLDSYLPHWELRATVTTQERRDVYTGALIDPYEE